MWFAVEGGARKVGERAIVRASRASRSLGVARSLRVQAAYSDMIFEYRRCGANKIWAMHTPRCRLLIAGAGILVIGLNGPVVAASTFTEAQICKAGIGMLMGRDPKTMSITGTAVGVVSLNYTRPSDGSRWAYRCKVEGPRIMWASDTGRWRDDPRDEQLLYSIVGDSIEVTERLPGSGDSTRKVFRANQLGR